MKKGAQDYLPVDCESAYFSNGEVCLSYAVSVSPVHFPDLLRAPGQRPKSARPALPLPRPHPGTPKVAYKAKRKIFVRLEALWRTF